MIKDENSYISAALHCYSNNQCVTLDEFKEDLNRIGTIKRCISNYIETGDINCRLVLNHLIILYNVFGDTTFELLNYKLELAHRPVAFAFLVKIDRLDPKHMIMLDQIIVRQLREI